MDIAIDGFHFSRSTGGGIATYSRNLSHALHDLNHKVHVVFGNPSGKQRTPMLDEIHFFDRASGGSRINRARILLSALFQQSAKPHEVRISGIVDARDMAGWMPYADHFYNSRNLFSVAYKHFALYSKPLSIRFPNNIDIFHCTFPLPLRARGAANVCTLLDLIPLKLPHTTLHEKRKYFQLVKNLAEGADVIATLSESSKKDIAELLGIPREKIHVSYPSVNIPEKFLNLEVDRVASMLEGSLQLDYGQYFLFLGAIEPRKNLRRLIEAFLTANVSQPLVIAGPSGWLSEGELSFYNAVQKASAESSSRIKFVGYLSSLHLVSLLRGARALLFPSLYEGYGLPALEAMLLGCPVLTSQISSLPEICGDAALYVDPYDTIDICSGIRKLAGNNELVAEMKHKGPAQAQKFSNSAYQASLKQIYDSAVK